MFFSDRGTVYWLKVHEIPQGGRAARGKPVVNCINIREGERVSALVPVRKFSATTSGSCSSSPGTVRSRRR